jgi:hypothetical protein
LISTIGSVENDTVKGEDVAKEGFRVDEKEVSLSNKGEEMKISKEVVPKSNSPKEAQENGKYSIIYPSFS